MNTIELHDGRELSVDLHNITIVEWRKLFDNDTEFDEEDAIIGRVVGLSKDEVQKLTQPDYRLVMKTVLDKAREPLDDPNSPSAST